jgi:universal stress protein A
MNTLKSILAAVDLDEDSASYVLESARQLAPDTPIEVVHVLERNTYFNLGDPGAALVQDLHVRMIREVEDYLGRLCGRYGITNHRMLEGQAALTIQQHAEDGGHDLIVLGTHGRHGIKRLLGSTANAVLHGTACNVLAIRVPGDEVAVRPPAEKYRRILAAVDLSDESSQVLDIAAIVSRSETAELDALHVIKPFRHAYAGINPAMLSDIGLQFEHEADRHARTRLGELAVAHGLADSRTHVRHGAPHLEIQDLIRELDCDMLVIGTHGKHGMQLLLGSVANAVIHGVTCDVLAVRIR